MSVESAQNKAKEILAAHENLRDAFIEASQQKVLYSLAYHIKWHHPHRVAEALAVIDTLEFQFTGTAGSNREGEFLKAVYAEDPVQEIDTEELAA